jgi:hypothetical protein
VVVDDERRTVVIIKEKVKERYGKIALTGNNSDCCCMLGECCDSNNISSLSSSSPQILKLFENSGWTYWWTLAMFMEGLQPGCTSKEFTSDGNRGYASLKMTRVLQHNSTIFPM